MILIWGQSNYGKVDVVPRLCYVTTRFFHLYYVPLIPLASYVVLEGTENGNGFQGMPTSLSWRSVLAGWVRAVLVVCVIVGLAVALDGMAGDGPLRKAGTAEAVGVPLVFSGLSAVAYWVTRRGARAGHSRALALGELLGVPAEVVERCLMGLPPAEEPEDRAEPGAAGPVE